ncbi:hypothetical protein FKM82_003916 [Ascaphus truei]
MTNPFLINTIHFELLFSAGFDQRQLPSITEQEQESEGFYVSSDCAKRRKIDCTCYVNTRCNGSYSLGIFRRGALLQPP